MEINMNFDQEHFKIFQYDFVYQIHCVKNCSSDIVLNKEGNLISAIGGLFARIIFHIRGP